MNIHTRGITVILVLVFMGVFATAMGMLSSYLLTQAKVARAKYAREQAFGVAEYGLEYYRWFLAHNPNDLMNGTGQPGPYSYSVDDPEGGPLGTATISIGGNSSCGVVQSIDITSQGASSANPSFKRTLIARYARRSVAEYSTITNSSVWAGADRVIVGPYHSNGGIRMDGTNNSTVSSAVSTWTCTSSFGCSPNQNVAGVWGAGSGSAFWKYPVPNFNFAGIASNFTALKGYAQTQGRYFPNISTSGQRGYHLVFQSNNTVNVYRVDATNWHWTIHLDDLSTWKQDYHQITSQTLLGNYTIPAGCPVIFAEDNLWLEGTVASKVTVIAASPGTSYHPSIILQGNIGYTAVDGSVGLTAIADQSVVYGYNIPDAMTVRGVFVAQNGYYGRNLYACWDAPYGRRTSLSLHGSVVSNGRIGTKWTYTTSGCSSNSTSGFLTRTDTYDRLLAFSPPPFTPFATTDFSFTIWREQ